MDHGLGQRETFGDRFERPEDPKKPARGASLENGGTYGLFSETGLDQPSIVDANVEIREMLPRYPCSCRKGEKRKRVLRRDSR